jgi:murein DD-endopeptidase MepM/ murein hydrolase activator NlpD
MRIANLKVHLLWLIPLLVFDAFFFFWLWNRLSAPLPFPEDISIAGNSAKISFSFPTDRKLDRFNSCNFHPTASGRPESALYGSVRMELVGKKLYPSFHEGVDIAPLERDRAGKPRDLVLAAAGGKVAYVNRVAGNSNYGKYVVLAHGDSPDHVYSLYAHLDDICPDIKRHSLVGEGAVLGTMGSTSNGRILTANAHLHFEICLLLNSRFQDWFRKQKLKPDHGIYNGWNLVGIDPLAVYERQEEDWNNEYDLYGHLAEIPRAFELALKTQRQLDFFRRYPKLWNDAEFSGGMMVLACSENGLPLSGRGANMAETAALGQKRDKVIRVDPSALGRNGCRLVVKDNGTWRLGAEGKKWLSMLAY